MDHVACVLSLFDCYRTFNSNASEFLMRSIKKNDTNTNGIMKKHIYLHLRHCDKRNIEENTQYHGNISPFMFVCCEEGKNYEIMNAMHQLRKRTFTP